jgi:hypothetical protein
VTCNEPAEDGVNDTAHLPEERVQEVGWKLPPLLVNETNPEGESPVT